MPGRTLQERHNLPWELLQNIAVVETFGVESGGIEKSWNSRQEG
jgi:hypothetical protein